MLRDRARVSPRSVAEFELYDDVAGAARALRARGLLLFVITNQPDIARGLLLPAELDRMHAALQECLGADEVAFCPHTDLDQCECRKPRPGMLHALAGRWSVDLGASWVVGDTWRDMQAGKAAGCRTILVQRDGLENDPPPADAQVTSLSQAVAYIESAPTR